MDLDAERDRHPGQLEREPGGVDQGAAVRVEPSGEEEGTVDLGPHLCAAQRVRLVRQPRDLVLLDGDRQRPRALPLAVQPEVAHVGREPVEVVGAETRQGVVLLGPAGAAVVLAVRQRRVDRSRRCGPTPPSRQCAPRAAPPGGRGPGAWRGPPTTVRGSPRRRPSGRPGWTRSARGGSARRRRRSRRPPARCPRASARRGVGRGRAARRQCGGRPCGGGVRLSRRPR